VTFHTLRHTCASHLAMAGVDLATIREIMRHKSIEMTLRYAHLSPDHKKAAVEALGNALTASVKNEAKTA
jgi:integrase